MPAVEQLAEDHPDVVRLAHAMVEEMIGLYGGDVTTWKLVPPRGTWLVVRDDAGAAVALGGVIPLDIAVPGAAPDQGELKRVYVMPEARGRGLSKLVVAEAVALARGAGYRELWLETGTKQPVAIALYRSLGWRPIEPYGPYADSHSACFALDLA